MTSLLPEDLTDEITNLWTEYEEQKTKEARVVKALDKIEVGFQHNIADFSTWDENDKSYPVNYAEKYSEIDQFLELLNEINMEWRKRKIEKNE